MAGSSDPAARRSKVALVALGCRVNRADVDALAAALGAGFELAADGERADLVVVNTCSITNDAESAARQAIRRAARDHPGAQVVAAGCYAELRPAELARLPAVAAVVGARRQGALAAVLARLRDGAPPCEDDAGAGPWGTAPEGPARHTRPFLKVQDGCDQRCTFCVVPDARGPSRSLPFDEAIRRVALLGARHPEVVLTGVHLGAYGRDLAPRRSLEDLVREIARRGLAGRLRLSSVEPNELPLDLLHDRTVAAVLCPHLHLPLQSGVPRILSEMGRPYRPDVFRDVVIEASRAIPGACLGTDLLVGFPGETDEDHRVTVALVEALPLAYLHVFPFSPRPGTRAAALPGRLPSAVVRARVRDLLAISERKWRAYLGAQAQRELEVVVERVDGGLARGTSRQWVTVRWPSAGEVRGAVVRVRVEASDGAECFGVRASTFEARLPP